MAQAGRYGLGQLCLTSACSDPQLKAVQCEFEQRVLHSPTQPKAALKTTCLQACLRTVFLKAAGRPRGTLRLFEAKRNQGSEGTKTRSLLLDVVTSRQALRSAQMLARPAVAALLHEGLPTSFMPSRMLVNKVLCSCNIPSCYTPPQVDRIWLWVF